VRSRSKLRPVLAVGLVLGCICGGVYWYACKHPRTALATLLLSPERRADCLVAEMSSGRGFARMHAHNALLDMGSPAVPVLIECVGSEDERNSTRGLAAGLLASIGEPMEQILPTLIGCLRGAPSSVRATAAYELGRIGEDAAEAVPALTECLSDPSGFVRGAAARALGEIDDSLAVWALEQLLDDEHPWVRGRAELGLAECRAAQGED